MPIRSLLFLTVGLALLATQAGAGKRAPSVEPWQSDIETFRDEVVRTLDAAAGPVPGEEGKQHAALEKAILAVKKFAGPSVGWGVTCSYVGTRGPVIREFSGYRQPTLSGQTEARVTVTEYAAETAWKGVKSGDRVLCEAVIDHVDVTASRRGYWQVSVVLKDVKTTMTR